MKVPTPINPQTNVPSGALGYSRAFDISSGAQALGQVVQEYAREKEAENKKKELFKVSQLLIEETNSLQQDFDDRMQKEPMGAEGFTPRINAEYQTRHEQFVANMREQGFSDDAIEEASVRLGTLRSQFIAKAIDFQDKSEFAKVGADIDDLTVGLSQYANSNPMAVQSALDELQTSLDNSGLDEIEKEQIYQQKKDIILQGARQGYAIQNPETVIKLFDPKSLVKTQAGVADTGDANTPFDMGQYVEKNKQAEGTAKNKRSSAEGFFQFTSGTWNETYKKVYGNTGESDAQILAKRKDLEVATKVFSQFTSDNISKLSAAGKPVNDTTVYLSHFLGVADAIKVLNAHADTTIGALVQSNSIKANPAVFGKVKTAGDMLAWASKTMGIEQQPDGTFQSVPTATEDYLPITPGNIDVSQIRPVQNADGSVSTVQSITIEEDGKFYLIPTVVDGKVVSNDAAVDSFHTTGKHLGEFATQTDADNYAVALHKSEEKRVANALPIDGKTGIPIIDLSTGPERMQMLAWAKQAQGENDANFKAQVSVTHENAVNSYMTTGGYAGNKPTLDDYNKAYGPVFGPQKFAELNNAQGTGAAIQQFKTLPNPEIDRKVEELRPKDTASPTYTAELQAYNLAQQAAANIKKERQANPAAYLFSTFPGLASKFAQADTSEERKAAYSAVNEAYKQLGVEQTQRFLLTKTQAEELQGKYAGMSAAQKISQLEEWNNELGDLRVGFLRQLNKDGYGAGADSMMWTYLRHHPNDRSIMAQILDGQNVIKEDPARKPSQEQINIQFKDTVGSALSMLNPSASKIFQDAAAAIYVANGGRADAGSPIDTDTYEDALRRAVGGLPGNESSGIVDMTQGVVKDYTILPQGETETSFRNWVEQLVPGQLTRMSQEKLPPIYTTGREVPLQDIIDHGVFVAVAPNAYIIKMGGDGNPLKTATGSNYVVRITPRATQ